MAPSGANAFQARFRKPQSFLTSPLIIRIYPYEFIFTIYSSELIELREPELVAAVVRVRSVTALLAPRDRLPSAPADDRPLSCLDGDGCSLLTCHASPKSFGSARPPLLESDTLQSPNASFASIVPAAERRAVSSGGVPKIFNLAGNFPKNLRNRWCKSDQDGFTSSTTSSSTRTNNS